MPKYVTAALENMLSSILDENFTKEEFLKIARAIQNLPQPADNSAMETLIKDYGHDKLMFVCLTLEGEDFGLDCLDVMDGFMRAPHYDDVINEIEQLNL